MCCVDLVEADSMVHLDASRNRLTWQVLVMSWRVSRSSSNLCAAVLCGVMALTTVVPSSTTHELGPPKEKTIFFFLSERYSTKNTFPVVAILFSELNVVLLCSYVQLYVFLFSSAFSCGLPKRCCFLSVVLVNSRHVHFVIGRTSRHRHHACG
jgi:hypothetical protein